jgi:hypothetical protein
VLVSSTVKDLVVGSDIAFTERGSRELKGVPGEWSLFAVAGVWTPISASGLCADSVRDSPATSSRQTGRPASAGSPCGRDVVRGLSRAKIWQRVDAAGDD